MGEVNAHLKKYWWHYTEENPYRIKDYKQPKQKIKTITRRDFTDWNSDRGMATCYKSSFATV
jgi:hypothetical protein